MKSRKRISNASEVALKPGQRVLNADEIKLLFGCSLKQAASTRDIDELFQNVREGQAQRSSAGGSGPSASGPSTSQQGTSQQATSQQGSSEQSNPGADVVQRFLPEVKRVAETDPTVWTTLSELRLTDLVCRFKPVGTNKQFCMLIIQKLMGNILDSEPLQSAIYLHGEQKERYEEAVHARKTNKDLEIKTYTPRFAIRPTIDQLDAKLKSWFGLEVCEDNEPVPWGMAEINDYHPPDDIMGENGELLNEDDEEYEDEEEDEEEIEGEEEDEEEEEVEDEEGNEDEEEQEDEDESMEQDEKGPSTSQPSSSGPPAKESDEQME